MSKELKEFITAYITCALWCGVIDDDMDHTSDDLSEPCRKSLEDDAKDFFASFHHLFAGHEHDAGHDFWLTRNRQGAGFWDDPQIYGYKNAQELTEMSHPYGEASLYVGDDGYIHHM